MTDKQIRLLPSLGGDEARLLLENGERAFYKRIQSKIVQLVREYQVQLPLNCLQFFVLLQPSVRLGGAALLAKPNYESACYV